MRGRAALAFVWLLTLAACEYAFIDRESLVGEYISRDDVVGRLVLNEDGSYLLTASSSQTGAGRWNFQRYLGDASIVLTPIDGELAECDVRRSLSGEISVEVSRGSDLIFVKGD